jgi:hypothetical protein
MESYFNAGFHRFLIKGAKDWYSKHPLEPATQTIDERAALGDLKVCKGVFLVNIGDPKQLNCPLGTIQGTYHGMKKQGVKPDFVLIYIGPSVKYLTTAC